MIKELTFDLVLTIAKPKFALTRAKFEMFFQHFFFFFETQMKQRLIRRSQNDGIIMNVNNLSLSVLFTVSLQLLLSFSTSCALLWHF